MHVLRQHQRLQLESRVRADAFVVRPCFLVYKHALQNRRRISNEELIASGKAVRERKRLRKAYGKARWRKLKGTADVEFFDGTIGPAEIHWYEAHGIGAKEYKIRRILD